MEDWGGIGQTERVREMDFAAQKDQVKGLTMACTHKIQFRPAQSRPYVSTVQVVSPRELSAKEEHLIPDGGMSMSDVENEMDMLQRKLATKTREIEALVAEQQRLGELNAMESTDYARLRTYVEELIYKWQEAKVRASESNPDTEVNRLSPSARRSRRKSSNSKCDEGSSTIGSAIHNKKPPSAMALGGRSR